MLELFDVLRGQLDLAVPVVGVAMHTVLGAVLVALLQLVQEGQVPWRLRPELLDPEEGRIGRNLPGVELLMLQGAVVDDVQHPDE